MIVVRMILGGVLGFIVGAMLTGAIVAIVDSALGTNNRDIARTFAPFGGMLGTGIGATWLLLRSDRKR